MRDLGKSGDGFSGGFDIGRNFCDRLDGVLIYRRIFKCF